MSLKETIRRELYVVAHGQTWRFRAGKYSILSCIAGGMYVVGGWSLVGIIFGSLIPFAIIVHFFFRWKTHAWKKSWGPYKVLDGLR